MKFKNILLSCVLIFGSLTLSGCYTQLTMFQPESETEEFYQYSAAGPVRSIGIYAQDGTGLSLGMAYQLMYNRFRGFMGYGNRYNYYNPYYYGGYYNDYNFNKYTLAGHTMYVPWTPIKTPRTFTKDRLKTYKTNLNTTRSSNESDYTNTNGADTNSSNVSSTRSSTGSSSSSSSSSGGKRTTRRN